MVHVVLWIYTDCTEHGIVAAFNNEEDAKLLMRDLERHGDHNKRYEVVALEIR